jgi:hypothetical protein
MVEMAEIAADEVNTATLVATIDNCGALVPHGTEGFFLWARRPHDVASKATRVHGVTASIMYCLYNVDDANAHCATLNAALKGFGRISEAPLAPKSPLVQSPAPYTVVLICIPDPSSLGRLRDELQGPPVFHEEDAKLILTDLFRNPVVQVARLFARSRRSRGLYGAAVGGRVRDLAEDHPDVFVPRLHRLHRESLDGLPCTFHRFAEEVCIQLLDVRRVEAGLWRWMK